ncbi:MAG: 3-phenylpropionate/cinnamic acid dioxygenase subunit beta [Immundisolibacteraceae bacterium]|nr:ring-hydroxylating dioxygenase beta subunit [uncultured bacterium]MDF1819626.1 3-phenylpropionate/cinnamic acid dioxygenase subunit beta [Immundisolibacteraceae bacterium]
MGATAQKITKKPNPAKPSLELINDVQQFLYREARLQDAQAYRDWLTMLTDDIHYWMPTREQRYRSNPMEPDITHAAHYNDNYADLETRIRRTETGTCWSEDPATRSAHVVTNIEVELTDSPNEYRVYSLIAVYRNMNEDEEHTLYGHREDILRNVNGELKLARRKIIIDQNIFLSKSLNVYL